MIGDGIRGGRLFSWWRKGGPESKPIQIQFAPTLRTTRDYGPQSLELLLVNRSSVMVWVEEAMVGLTELDASLQTSTSTCQARHAIHQIVRSQDALSVSLSSDIYDAAGRPQGKYSCLVFTDIRYRVGDEWLNKTLDPCRVKMAALTVVGLRRSRWHEKKTGTTARRELQCLRHEEPR